MMNHQYTISIVLTFEKSGLLKYSLFLLIECKPCNLILQKKINNHFIGFYMHRMKFSNQANNKKKGEDIENILNKLDSEKYLSPYVKVTIIVVNI